MAIIDKHTQITVPQSEDKPVLTEKPADQQERRQAYSARQQKRRGISGMISLILTALVVLIILITPPSAFEQSVLSAKQRDPNVVPHVGTLVQPPLSATQLDALAHLLDHMAYKQLARMYVSHMTLDEKLGQLIMAEYYDSTYSSDLEYMITKLHAGGVVMYALQMHTFNQTKNDIAQMQKHAQLPLLISTDEEGGFVERVQNIYGHRPGALEIYQTGNVNNATAAGHKIAHDLQALGINVDLAPDVDVQLVNGPDQYLRTWGYTPQSVITYAGAYMRAVQGDGVIACIKHFPGLGDASTDAHYALPVIKRTREQIYSVELAPFKAFIQSHNKLDNPGMVMPTDVLMPAIDPKWPAELSPTFITGILRHEFGYDGVVITDGLYMKGITDKWSVPEAAVLAIIAGNDMILGPNGSYQMTQVLDALKAAYYNGRLTKARIDEAATRIITLKLERHIMPILPPQDYGFTA
ncbi:MAG: glycoside hydrolase family 3 N-terminal domain-containing protein [Ktedonobacteraceae bacterium]